jgi:hypothetical protein
MGCCGIGHLSPRRRHYLIRPPDTDLKQNTQISNIKGGLQMKYGLARLVLSSSAFLEITKEEYEQLKESKTNIIEALLIEEKIDLLLENYAELEIEMMRSSTRKMIFQDFEYESFQSEITLFARRLVNLLTSGRLYLDHKSHHLKKIFKNKPEELEQIELFKQSEYDQSLYYRAMDALRNYVQHRGFPIHSLSFPMKREGEDLSIIKFSITPTLILKDMEEDGKFKKSILKELKELGDKIDLKLLTREYVDSLVRIHLKTRDVLKPYLDNSENIYLDAIDKFKSRYPKEESIVGLSVGMKMKKGDYEKHFELFTKPIAYRKTLEKKNRSKGIFSKGYISTEIINKF